MPTKSSTAKKTAATRKRRAKLTDKPTEYLREQASKLDIPGRSGMNKAALVKAIDQAKSGTGPKRKPTQAARKTAATAKKAASSQRKGKGVFVLYIAKGETVYGKLGPYGSARSGQVDAKVFLRKMAAKGDHTLSHTDGMEFVGDRYEGGEIVDAWVAVPSGGAEDTEAAAFVVKYPKGSKVAYGMDKSALPSDLRSNGYGGIPKPSRKAGRANTYHRDGTVSYWDVYAQQWDRQRVSQIPHHNLASMDAAERARITSMGGSRKNTRGSAADSVAARELAMFIENDGTLYRGQVTSIITNLAKKLAKGQFDRSKAIKLMGYLADSGARKYMQEFGDPMRGPWQSYPMAKVSRTFSPATRRATAAILLDSYMEQIEAEAADLKGSRSRKNGTYYSVRLPAGYRTKWHSPRSAVTRGAFDTEAQARAWAKKNVPGLPFTIVAYDDGTGKRSNPRVSFKTKGGPVSFMAKKNAARMNGSKSVKGLKINGTRWRDSYGNTYHRAYISVNGRRAGVTPITYGYGSHYLQTAQKWLKEHGYRKPSARMSSYDAGYDDVKRKKDL